MGEVIHVTIEETCDLCGQSLRGSGHSVLADRWYHRYCYDTATREAISTHAIGEALAEARQRQSQRP